MGFGMLGELEASPFLFIVPVLLIPGTNIAHFEHRIEMVFTVKFKEPIDETGSNKVAISRIT